jgi:LCP family protein required for cell wall assembly
MSDQQQRADRPEYTVYRSRPGFLRRGEGRLRPDDGDREPRAPRRRPGLRPGRVVKWLLLGVLGWLLVSLLIFLVSAQIQRAGVSDAASGTLSGAGFTLTSPNTILILGSDRRTEGLAEPGSSTTGPSRADSIMLMRVGGGANATLSIPRDTVVDIPGSGQAKINAAYAIGGPALAVTTVEQYLGIEVNHLVEVNFENFPALIDALGGVTVKTGCVVSKINGGTRNGGYTLRLERGENELDGEQALALARTRKNDCAPREDDRTRARRQQQILAAMKSKIVSFETFIRLPWVSWAGPKAVQSDMAGPSLLGVAGASLLGGGASARVLRPSGGITLPDGGAGLVVSEDEKRRAVARFLRG